MVYKKISNYYLTKCKINYTFWIEYNTFVGILQKMKTRYLLSYKFKPIGWWLIVPSFIAMILVLYFNISFTFLEYQVNGKVSFDKGFLFNLELNNFTDEVFGLLLIAGLFMVAFSKEKIEDERIRHLRLESLLWAMLVNTLFLAFSIIFFYNDLFIWVMTYNIATPLVLFILRFNALMYLERRKLKKEDL